MAHIAHYTKINYRKELLVANEDAAISDDDASRMDGEEAKNALVLLASPSVGSINATGGPVNVVLLVYNNMLLAWPGLSNLF